MWSDVLAPFVGFYGGLVIMSACFGFVVEGFMAGAHD